MSEQEANEILWQDRKHHMWFPFSFTKYTVQGGRLYIKRGFLSTTYDETLLYRITDISMHKTLGQRIFGTGTIILKVQADATSCQHLVNIRYPEDVRNFLSELIEKERRKYGVEGREMYGSTGKPHPGTHGECPEGLDMEVPPEEL